MSEYAIYSLITTEGSVLTPQSTEAPSGVINYLYNCTFDNMSQLSLRAVYVENTVFNDCNNLTMIQESDDDVSRLSGCNLNNCNTLVILDYDGIYIQNCVFTDNQFSIKDVGLDNDTYEIIGCKFNNITITRNSSDIDADNEELNDIFFSDCDFNNCTIEGRKFKFSNCSINDKLADSKTKTYIFDSKVELDADTLDKYLFEED